ncbi:hypothetical protein Hanom_Chr06g00517781 [Helianthus anomalus]
MKVRIGTRNAKVGTELVLNIFRFGKFSTGTQYHLLIFNHRFHVNNIITIQLIY